MTGAWWLWNRSHSIHDCETEGNTSTKSSVCIMLTRDLLVNPMWLVTLPREVT